MAQLYTKISLAPSKYTARMTSNNAIILKVANTFGPIIKGQTLTFEHRPCQFPELKDGEFIVQTMYLSVDPYMALFPTLAAIED
jgi:NADPH-dependent curcumin reductase CurA